LRPRRPLLRPLLIAIALGAIAACADSSAGPPRPAQPQELCKEWGYAPSDPNCLRLFRRDPH